MSTTLIFVYGTLKRGGSNHAFLAAQRFRGEARTPPGYALYSLGDYPGMVRDRTDSEGVTGEVWDVDAAALAKLDELEGVAEGLYTRECIRLSEPWSTVEVHTYLYARALEGRARIGPTWHEPS